MPVFTFLNNWAPLKAIAVATYREQSKSLAKIDQRLSLKAQVELLALTDAEQNLYQCVCSNRWAKNLRLEQERISWPYAWGQVLNCY